VYISIANNNTQNKRSYVRFYRDSSIADLVFTAFSSIIAAYLAFQPPIRTGLCEELSSQPDFLRDMVEFGLTLENCELWFERAVLLSFVIAVVLVGIRVRISLSISLFLFSFSLLQLHFLLTVSRYYSYFNRHPHHPSSDNNLSLQRLYLLPPSPSTPNQSPTLYAPVTSLSPDAARDLRATATTAWISHTAPDSSQFSHSHSHRHRYHHPSTPRIALPVTPDISEDKSLLDV
jgi:hypothetical protein